MANDTEFTGTIKLTADTSEAEKKVEQVGTGKGGKDAAPAPAEVSDLTKRISTVVNDLFGRAGKAATGAMSKTGGVFGDIGALFGMGGKAAGAAGAAGGAGGAMAALGPVGIVVAGIVGLGVGAMAVAESFKSLTERLMDFGRTLTTVSPSMALVFAEFDRSMMMLKQQLGEALAPAFSMMLQSVTSALIDLAPIIGEVVVGLTSFVSHMIVSVQGLIALHEFTASALRMMFWPSAANQQAAINDWSKLAALDRKEQGMPGIIESIEKFRESWERNEARKTSGMVMSEFMQRINADGSAQRAYQDAFHAGGPSAQAAPAPHIERLVPPRMVGKGIP